MRNKSIYDPLHGLMEFNDTCLQIIDTPEFQRLRDIKQLGTCYYIFPGASHNRFEHSLGVAYLAKNFIKNIVDKQPELNISPHMINLIQIAGLCHDLGHGPFSHIFDHKFVNLYNHIDQKDHENRSCRMIEHMAKKYNLSLTKVDLDIILELINPQKYNLKNKFLYQIINNTDNSIDVDKLDYIKRDIYNTGIKLDFDYQRLLQNARVINDKIVYSNRIESDIYDLFRIRNELHRRIYTHPVVRSIEFMIVDCLHMTNDIFNLSNQVDNPEKFKNITDNILDLINIFPNDFKPDLSEKLIESKKIIMNIKQRRFYKFIGEIQLNDDDNISYDYNYFKSNKFDLSNLDNKDILLDKVTIGYREDPVNKVMFYDSNSKQIISRDHMKRNLSRPNRSFLSTLRFYSCHSEKNQLVFNLFKSFHKKYRISEEFISYKRPKN